MIRIDTVEHSANAAPTPLSACSFFKNTASTGERRKDRMNKFLSKDFI